MSISETARPARAMPALHPLFDLRGRKALVTGATRGIGKAIARVLGEAGASVIIVSNESAACDTVATELRSAGIAASAIACDLSIEADIDGLVSRVRAQEGHLDVLVCNAGIEGPLGPLGTAGTQAVSAAMQVNLLSSLQLTSAILPDMAAAGGGSVVLMSSIAGMRGNKSIGAYGLTKAAVAQLARNLAVEWGPKNIRVNAISPGVIRTDFSRQLMADKEYLARRLSLTPLRRTGEVDDVAGAVLFLAAPAGAFVTGHNLVIDGGTMISDGN